MNTDRFDLVAVLSIAIAGLVAAVVCFGLLSSTANIDNAGVSLGGAIAGAVATMYVLGKQLGNLRASRSEILRLGHETRAEIDRLSHEAQQQIAELRRKNQELQQKLIRGAPHPEAYDIEVDERQRLVLARPNDWERRGGTIFEFQEPSLRGGMDDIFPARVRVSHEPIDATTPQEASAYYSQRQQQYVLEVGPDSGPYRVEFIHLGGEPVGIRSLRLTVQEFVEVRDKVDPVSGERSREELYINRDGFEARIYSLVTEVFDRQITASADIRDVRRVAEAKKEIAADLRHAFERGEFRDLAALRAHLEAQLAESPNNGATPGQTVAPARPIAGTEDPAENVASRGARELHAPVHSWTVIPVGHMVVFCYHSALQTIFRFDFSDNAADFTQASEVFGHMLRSVRFLA